jgi:LPXTG-motif cell wall-anchored protein
MGKALLGFSPCFFVFPFAYLTTPIMEPNPERRIMGITDLGRKVENNMTDGDNTKGTLIGVALGFVLIALGVLVAKRRKKNRYPYSR